MTLSLSAENIKKLLEGALAALRVHQNELNKLNVYPVPDGDTGTNLSLTLQAVWEAVEKVEVLSIKSLAEAFSYGSLIGARGNSGVILSQIIRGMCEVLESKDTLEAQTIVEALGQGAKVAYQAIRKPVEGTMLTVIKDIAAKAKTFSGKDIEIETLLEAVLEEARESVERTPELLDVLKEAGVVDAGGYGLAVMLEGALSALKGEEIKAVAAGALKPPSLASEEVSLEYTYCTEFLLKSEGIDSVSLEKKLSPLGNSLMVVGPDKLTRVHVHTNSPGTVLELATSMGSLSQVKINNMVEQSQERALKLSKKAVKKTGVIAVASGEGVEKILLSLGVDKVVEGGVGSNPSTAEIAEAAEEAPSKEVIILPNNKNIILAAEQVQRLVKKGTFVVPTKTIPEAFSALLVYDGERSASFNLREMKKALGEVKTGEITLAVRNSASSAGKIKKGDFIGLFDHKIKAVGKTLKEVAQKVLEEMVKDSDEVITVLAGKDVSQEERKALLEDTKKKYPNLEVELLSGEQPLYHLIIGIE